MSEAKNILSKFLAITAFLGFVVVFYFLIGQDKTELPSQLIDRAAPVFKVRDLIQADLVHTEQDFIGKITLLNVWASWCPSCYVEHPFWKEYTKNPDLTIVSLNYRDKEAKALKFINDLGNPYQWILFDEKGRIGIEFGVYGAPETFLIDPKGKIRYRHVGVVTPEVYEKILIPLIDKIKKGF